MASPSPIGIQPESDPLRDVREAAASAIMHHVARQRIGFNNLPAPHEGNYHENISTYESRLSEYGFQRVWGVFIDEKGTDTLRDYDERTVKKLGLSALTDTLESEAESRWDIYNNDLLLPNGLRPHRCHPRLRPHQFVSPGFDIDRIEDRWHHSFEAQKPINASGVGHMVYKAVKFWAPVQMLNEQRALEQTKR